MGKKVIVAFVCKAGEFKTKFKEAVRQQVKEVEK